MIFRRRKPAQTPETAQEAPAVPKTTTTPQQAAQHRLEAATAEAENAALHVARLRAAFLADDPAVTPADIDAADTQAKHTSLALDAARAAHERAHEQARRDAWPYFRDDVMGSISDDATRDLRDRLDALSLRLTKAVAEIQAAIAEASAPAEKHNEAVAALAGYVTGGGYVDPEDRVSTFGDSVTCRGHGGARIDAQAVVDGWLRDCLPSLFEIEDWIARVRRADLLAGRPNPTR